MNDLQFVCVPDSDMHQAARLLSYRHLLATISLAESLTREFANIGSGESCDTGNLNYFMWRKNSMSLAFYGEILVAEAKRVGLSQAGLDACAELFSTYIDSTSRWPGHYPMVHPAWLSNRAVIEAHRAYLKYTDIETYWQQWPDVQPLLLPIPAEGGLSVYGHVDVSSLW